MPDLLPSRRAITVVLMMTLLQATPAASADPQNPGIAHDRNAGLVWIAQTVRHPFPVGALKALNLRDGGQEALSHGRDTRAAVSIDAQRGLAIQLEPLELVRVRIVGDPNGTDQGTVDDLRIVRLGGQTDVASYLEDPGLPVDPMSTYLLQPPGDRSVWVITARRSLVVVTERPHLRTSRTMWSDVFRDVPAWIDRGGALPDIPRAEGSAQVVLGLLADEDLHALLRDQHASSPQAGAATAAVIDRALCAWRKARALEALYLVAPHRMPFFRHADLTGQVPGVGAAVSFNLDDGDEETQEVAQDLDWRQEPARPWRRLAADQTFDLDLSGSGVLVLETRPLWAAPVTPRPMDNTQPAPRDVLIEVDLDGVPHATLHDRLGPAAVAVLPRHHQATVSRLPLVTDGNEAVGYHSTIRVPLAPGAHRYRVRLKGGPLAIRAAAIVHRPRLSEAVTGSMRPGRYLQEADEALAGQPGIAAGAVRYLIATMRREKAPADGASLSAKEDGVMAALLIANAGALPSLPVGVPKSLAADLITASLSPKGGNGNHTRGPLADLARVRIAARLVQTGEDPLALQLLRSAPRPGDVVMAEAALAVPRAPDAMKSQALAALEMAFRNQPHDPSTRRAWQKHWLRASRWRTVDTIADVADGDKGASAAFTWLELDDPADADAQDEAQHEAQHEAQDGAAPGRVWTLDNHRLSQIVAPLSRFDSARPALLRIFAGNHESEYQGEHEVESNAHHVTLQIDGRTMTTTSFAAHRVEKLEVAIAPGPHALRIAGPPGGSYFSNLAPSAKADGAPVGRGAYVRRMWPIRADDRPVRFALPADTVPGPVRIRLRALVPAGSTRSDAGPGAQGATLVTLHTDVGPTRTLRLAPTGIDPLLVPVDAPGRGSMPATFVVWLPPTTGAIWFSTRGDRALVAQVATRAPRPVDGDADPAHANAPGRAQSPNNSTRPQGDLAHLHQLSARLLSGVPVTPTLIERAHVLLDLNEGASARADILRLLTDPARDSARAPDPDLQDLVDRFEAWRDPSHVRFVEVTSGVVPLRPTSLAIPPEAGDAPKRAYREARALAARQENAAAAVALMDLAERHQIWQADLESMDHVMAAVAAAGKLPPGFLARARFVAERLRGRIAHFDAGRVLAATSEGHRWLPLRLVEGSAGFENLYTDRDDNDLSDNGQLRHALSGSPWSPSHAHVLRAGMGATLSIKLDAPAKLAFEAWCAPYRPPDHQAAIATRCPARWQVDNRPTETATFGPGAAHTQPAVTLIPGMHRMEIVHTAPQDNTLLVVRFLADRPLFDDRPDRTARQTVPVATAVAIQQPSQWSVSQPGRPYQVTILGPTVLRLAGRVLGQSDARQLILTAQSLVQGSNMAVTHTLALDPTAEPSATGDRSDPFATSVATTSQIYLPHVGAYRLTVVPDAGSALVQTATREEGVAALPAPPQPLAEVMKRSQTPWPWPPLPPDPLIEAPSLPDPERDRVPMISVGARVAREDFGDRDGIMESPSDVLTLTGHWRRHLLPHAIWLRVGGISRMRDQGAAGGGGDLTLHVRNLPGGLRVAGQLTGLSQSVHGRQEWSATGNLGVNRFINLGASFALLPALGLRLRHFTLDRAHAPPTATMDPLVYNHYGDTHRRALSAGISGLWLGLADQLGILGVRAISNADMGSADYLQGNLTWRGLLDFFGVTHPMAVPYIELGYKPEYRFADRHRADGITRHALGAGLALAMWVGRTSRVVLEFRDDLYLSSGSRMRNTFGLALRFDYVGSRGLQDLLPDENDFADLLAPSVWDPVR